MQARTRKTLTIWWVVILACMVLPFPFLPIVHLGAIIGIAWLVAIPLAIVTLVKSERDAHLQRPGWYHAALAAQALIAVAGAFAAARTVFADGRPGLISVATVQLATAVLTWRAYTNPAPRRAIIAAISAGFVTFVSLLIDIALDINLAPVRHYPVVDALWSLIAVWSVIVSWIGGGLVCLAAIHAFGAKTNLPDARVA